LLSPQDLAGLEVLPELARAGVASLKIEGRSSRRNTSPTSRAFTGNAWIDCDLRNKETKPGKLCCRCFIVQIPNRYEMEMSFSRGLFTGWFGGTDNQALVHARFGKKRGVLSRRGEKNRPRRRHRQSGSAVKPGDGIVFDAGRPDEKEEGGRIYEVQVPRFKIPGQQLSELRFGYGDVEFLRVHIGDKIWKTNDPELDKRLRQSFAGDVPKFQRPIEIEVHGGVGKPLTLIARDEFGSVAKVESTMPLAKAEKIPLTEEKLREQLGRLGGTPFKLGEMKIFLTGEVLLPVSELNRLRREFVTELEKLRAQPKRWELRESRSPEPRRRKC
jgi:putative protease